MHAKFLTTWLVGACIMLSAPMSGKTAEPICRSTVTGRLDIRLLESRVFGNTRKLRIWLPPNYVEEVSRRYPVLYLLDGQDLFDACTASDATEWHVDEIMTDLLRRHSVEPAIIVGIDSLGEQERMHEYLPYKDVVVYPTMPEPAGKQFPEFLGNEVLPFINMNYRAEYGPKYTSLGGASYGAIAALYTLLMRPDLFGAGIIESPALQVGNGQLLRDTAFLVAAPSRVFLSMGTNEVPGQPLLNSGLVGMFQALVRNIETAYMAKAKVDSVVQEGGTHDERSWSAMFERGVVFLYKSQ